MGGLVIKQLLRRAVGLSESRAQAQSFIERVEKVAFLATPHTGAGLANLCDILQIIIQPSQATNSLRRNDPNLRDLNDWYWTWADKIDHLVLTETKSYRGLGLVVPPDSSDPKLVRQKLVPVDCDHENICKPSTRNDEVYRHIRDFIEKQVERPRDRIAEVAEGQQRNESKLDQILAILDQSGETARAAEKGLERRTILELARRLKPDEVIDFDQAVKELENAVDVALDVIARGGRASNEDALVNDVLALLAETTKAGRFDTGSQAVDHALAEIDLREEEQSANNRRSRETLLEAGVKQDILRRDAFAVARRIEAIAALDPADGHPAWSPKYEKRLRAFFDEGTEKGVNFSLEIVIEMASRMLATARDSDQRGTALNNSGGALAVLGERESGTVKLEQAIAAFRNALRERNRERAPREWAQTHGNLGTALRRLAEREASLERLNLACASFYEALTVLTRAESPLDWAVAKMNLGGALGILGKLGPEQSS